jgi:hypothetical protein
MILALSGIGYLTIYFNLVPAAADKADGCPRSMRSLWVDALAYAVAGDPPVQYRQTIPHGSSKRILLAFTMCRLSGAGPVPWQSESRQRHARGDNDPLDAVKHIGDRRDAPNRSTSLEAPQLLATRRIECI